jgi:hypothetical protein
LLAVSGVGLVVLEPTGEDELFVLETRLAPMPAIVELGRRVTCTERGTPVDWSTLPAANVGGVALLIRRAWLGDAIRTDATCPVPECGERIDVSFEIERYIAHHRPRRPRAVAASDEDGWYALRGANVRFRIPTTADVLAAIDADSPAVALTERCMQGTATGSLARRIDRALAAMAPRLESFVGGTCPSCGQEVSLRFDPVSYTLTELRDSFSGLYLETHLLASAYGWQEAEILALPRHRRRRYAALVDSERAAA